MQYCYDCISNPTRRPNLEWCNRYRTCRESFYFDAEADHFKCASGSSIRWLHRIGKWRWAFDTRRLWGGVSSPFEWTIGFYISSNREILLVIGIGPVFFDGVPSCFHYCMALFSLLSRHNRRIRTLYPSSESLTYRRLFSSGMKEKDSRLWTEKGDIISF